MMRRKLRKALVLVAVGYLLSAGALAVAVVSADPVVALLLAVGLVLGVPAWAWRARRTEGFREKLDRFVRQLLAGNYEAGVQPSRTQGDEVAELEARLNKLAEHLRTYDALRADRVASSVRAVDQLMRAAPCPVLAADLRKNALRLNPAAQEALHSEPESHSFEALRNQPGNRDFLEALKEAQNQSTPSEKRAVDLHLPAGKRPTPIDIRLVPVRGRDESVAQVFVFPLPDPSSGTTAEPADHGREEEQAEHQEGEGKKERRQARKP